MNELMNTRRGNIRWNLLATASATALLASTFGAARAEEGRPIIWIEGGWQFEQVSGLGDTFDPPFVPSIIAAGLPLPLDLQKALGYSAGAEGKILFQPENSDWVFSVSLRYGRARGQKFLHKELPGPVTHVSLFGSPYTGTALNHYAETKATNREAHILADFEVGKDVGLGMFGGHGMSILGLGVRFAQFRTLSTANINGRPDNHWKETKSINFPGKYFPASVYHDYVASARKQNSFTGIGPSISWNASAPLVGQPLEGEIALDWGANAAFLFGKQKTRVHRQSYSTYVNGKYYSKFIRAHNTANPVRNRSVVVPNVGGFAGLSFRYSAAKLSLGYRADFFFGAMDGGIDTRKSENRGFYGPFATISVGLGG